MSNLRDAAQQALEAMHSFEWSKNGLYAGEFETEIAALRKALAEEALQRLTDVNQEIEAALAEPAQEPAFHGFMSDDGTQVDVCFSPSAPRRDGTYATAYYTAPPQRMSAQNELDDAMRTPRAMAQAYEAGWRAALAQLQQVGWMQKSTGVIRCDWGFDTTGYVPVYAAQEQSE